MIVFYATAWLLIGSQHIPYPSMKACENAKNIYDNEYQMHSLCIPGIGQ